MSDFVEQKLFTSEVKRLDSEITNIKKAEEKQDKTVFEAINRLHGDMDRRFERLEDEMHSNFRWLIGMYITGLVGTLAAFYAFASYIKG